MLADHGRPRGAAPRTSRCSGATTTSAVSRTRSRGSARRPRRALTVVAPPGLGKTRGSSVRPAPRGRYRGARSGSGSAPRRRLDGRPVRGPRGRRRRRGPRRRPRRPRGRARRGRGGVGIDEDERGVVGGGCGRCSGRTEGRGRPRVPATWPTRSSGSWAAAATRGPTVLVVEDTHWADPAAREVLALLGPRSATRRSCSCSPPRGPRCSPSPAGRRHGANSPARRRGDPRAAPAVSGHDLSDQDAARIADRAEGNPLFAIEFGRTIDEGGDAALPTSNSAR